MFSSSQSNSLIEGAYPNQRQLFANKSDHSINGNISNGSNNENNIQQFAPNFLFGSSNASRRRTLALSSLTTRC